MRARLPSVVLISAGMLVPALRAVIARLLPGAPAAKDRP